MKNKNNNKNKYVYGLMSLAVLTILATAVPVFVDNTATPQVRGAGHFSRGMGMGTMHPGVFGKVTAINGNSITIDGKKGFGTTATNVTYTIDTTNSTVTKNGTTSSVSSIAIGDTIFAQGTLTGTSVVATTIRDGVMQGKPNNTGQNNALSAITGNGQPVVLGTITSVSGSTVIITNKSNVTYTVDTSSAKIVKSGNTISTSNLSVGDAVIVQGTVNGTDITAASVMDQTPAITSSSSGTTPASHRGFFGSIGSFFAHLFGF